MKILFFLVLFSVQAWGYTLNNNFGASFGSNRVSVQVAGNSTCGNSGLTVYELEEMIKPSVDDFWNEVPTSSLRLKPDGFSDSIDNINTGKLCAPTDDECITDAGAGNVIPPVTGIIIACNSNADNFGGNSVIAVTIPNNFSGKKIKGAVILINDSTINSPFKNLSRRDRIGVLAHEIGHAIGLGHAKDDTKEALMYYRTVDLRKNLAQDDVDGVTYLYPIKMDACGLFGTLTDAGPKQGPPFWQMGITLFLMIFILEIKKLLKRSKACSPA